MCFFLREYISKIPITFRDFGRSLRGIGAGFGGIDLRFRKEVEEYQGY